MIEKLVNVMGAIHQLLLACASAYLRDIQISDSLVPWHSLQFVSAMREQQLLDDDFVSYLNYLIRHEKGEIEKTGLDPDREPTTWLMVRKSLQAFTRTG